MRTRNYLAVLALTLALGVGAAGVLDVAERTFTAAAAPRVSQVPTPPIVVPPPTGEATIEAPVAPVVREVSPPEETIGTSLVPKSPPYPRDQAFAVALRLAGRSAVPDAPTPIPEPESPVLVAEAPEPEVVFERPELAPVALSAPTVVPASDRGPAAERRRPRPEGGSC